MKTNGASEKDVLRRAWKEAIDNGCYVGVIFVEFKKALGIVNRYNLKRELQAVAICGDLYQWLCDYQAIPRESPNTILSNTRIVGSNGKRTSQLMFYVPQGLMKKFSGSFLISVSLLATDLECLIRNLIFNSLRFK